MFSRRQNDGKDVRWILYWNFLCLNYFGEDVEWILLILEILYVFCIFVQVILGFVFYTLRMNLMFVKLNYRAILNLNLRK